LIVQILQTGFCRNESGGLGGRGTRTAGDAHGHGRQPAPTSGACCLYQGGDAPKLHAGTRPGCGITRAFTEKRTFWDFRSHVTGDARRRANALAAPSCQRRRPLAGGPMLTGPRRSDDYVHTELPNGFLRRVPINFVSWAPGLLFSMGADGALGRDRALPCGLHFSMKTTVFRIRPNPPPGIESAVADGHDDMTQQLSNYAGARGCLGLDNGRRAPLVTVESPCAHGATPTATRRGKPAHSGFWSRRRCEQPPPGNPRAINSMDEHRPSALLLGHGSDERKPRASHTRPFAVCADVLPN